MHGFRLPFALLCLLASALVSSCAEEQAPPRTSSTVGPSTPGTTTAKAESLPSRTEIDRFIQSLNIDKSAEGWRTRLPKPPAVRFDAKERILWELEITGSRGEGTMRIEMLPEQAPRHVANFIYLTNLGYFDGLKFHRIMAGFMAQGGCPLGDGSGAPGYALDGEIDPEKNRHDAFGVLSSANSGPGTDGSQFFLTFAPTPHLDDRHTIFGRIAEGQKTLWSLANYADPTGATQTPTDVPTIKAARMIFESTAP